MSTTTSAGPLTAEWKYEYPLPVSHRPPFLKAVKEFLPRFMWTEQITAALEKNGENLQPVFDRLTERDTTTLILRAFPIPFVDLQLELDGSEGIRAEDAEKSLFVPMAVHEDYAAAVTPAPWNMQIIRGAIRQQCPKIPESKIAVYYCPPSVFSNLLQNYKNARATTGAEAAEKIKALVSVAEQIPVLDIYDTQPTNDVLKPVFEYAINNGATDIHFQSDGNGASGTVLRVRMRCGDLFDFDLKDVKDGRQWTQVLKNRLRTICNVPDMASPKLDGKFRVIVRKSGARQQKVELDVRLGSLFGTRGPHITLRLLDKTKKLPGFNDLFTYAPQLKPLVTEFINMPSGIMLTSGPTGSGKTTTLNAIISYMALMDSLMICTIEDPVEYELPNVTQYNLDTLKRGLDPKLDPWVEALKALLRMDPDTVLVGELRDRDVMAQAQQIAGSGHQVLSTIHTESAYAIGGRVESMGVPMAVFADPLKLVVAQRIIPKICPQCSDPLTANTIENATEILKTHGLPLGWAKDMVEDRAKLRLRSRKPGCNNCGGNGYKGMVLVMEAVDYSHELVRKMYSEALYSGRKVMPYEIEKLARSLNWDDLARSCLRAIYNGATDMDSVTSRVFMKRAVADLNDEFSKDQVIKTFNPALSK